MTRTVKRLGLEIDSDGGRLGRGKTSNGEEARVGGRPQWWRDSDSTAEIMVDSDAEQTRMVNRLGRARGRGGASVVEGLDGGPPEAGAGVGKPDVDSDEGHAGHADQGRLLLLRRVCRAKPVSESAGGGLGAWVRVRDMDGLPVARRLGLLG